MGNEDQPVETTKGPAIPSALKEQSVRVANLTKALIQLERRLEPVLEAHPQDPMKDDAADAKRTVAEEIRVNTNAVITRRTRSSR